MNANPKSPIELYLDDLLGTLRGTPREVRRALSECEAHLRDAADALELQGFSEDEAARRATEQFGDARALAADFNHTLGPAWRRALMLSLLRSAWRLSGVGFIAIGQSGVVAWIAMQATSTGAVFAAPPNTHFGAGACTYWMHLHPSAATCASAALLEGRDDALFQRFALGVLGCLILLISAIWNRRVRRDAPIDLRMPTALIAITAFGLAGSLLTGYGIDRAVQNTGAGQWLASGAVSLAFAIAYLIALLRAAPGRPAG
jgi:hypothetical protein